MDSWSVFWWLYRHAQESDRLAHRRTVGAMPTTTPHRPAWSAPRRAFTHGPPTPRPNGLVAVYRRLGPRATLLYPIVQHHLETFLADATEADPYGEGVRRWVEDDFRAYLRYGSAHAGPFRKVVTAGGHRS